MDNIVNVVAAEFGLTETNILLVVIIASMVSRLIGKSIPDDATGYLAVIRKIAKVVGLYTSNRISRGVTVTDAAKTALNELNK